MDYFWKVVGETLLQLRSFVSSRYRISMINCLRWCNILSFAVNGWSSGLKFTACVDLARFWQSKIFLSGCSGSAWQPTGGSIINHPLSVLLSYSPRRISGSSQRKTHRVEGESIVRANAGDLYLCDKYDSWKGPEVVRVSDVS